MSAATKTRPAGTVVSHGDVSSALAAAARASSAVYLDTETDGLDWAGDVLRTVQAHVPGMPIEVVRVGEGRPAVLLALLEDESVTKVFHHAMFDLRFLVRRWNVRAASVRCTKIAAKLLDPDGAHSLAPLLRARLGIVMDKTQQTSNWAEQALSAAQVRYAADDVVHLPALHHALSDDLAAASLTGLYDACCGHIPARVLLDVTGRGDVFAY